MKSFFVVTLSFVLSCGLYAQKKERIKGSRIVTQTTNSIEDFSSLEIEDNLEIFLTKNETPSIEVEADDNLHDIISFAVVGNTLKISTLKAVSSSKKLSLKINYTQSLHTIIAKGETKLNAINELQLDSISISSFDKAELNINAKANFFKLTLNDKSEGKINVKANKTQFEASKNAELEALLSSESTIIDMYESSKITLEGSTDDFTIRQDNSSRLYAKKYTSKNIKVTVENNAKAELNALNLITISASEKSQVDIYGEPKIEIERFANSATLYKKE